MVTKKKVELPPDTTDLGALLRELRASRKMSQPVLARAAGVSGGYIAMLETGARGHHPSREKLTAIAQALATDAVEFARIMDAGGYPMERQDTDARERYRNVVMTDPFLRADQKQLLVATYDSLAGRAAR